MKNLIRSITLMILSINAVAAMAEEEGPETGRVTCYEYYALQGETTITKCYMCTEIDNVSTYHSENTCRPE